MPRIDPLQLLNCLNVLLTPAGGIKSEQEVARISSLMEKFSKKLVSKCVYLLILKSSDVQLLSKFMGLGGWNLIYNWLLHAVEAKNFPFLIELLEVIIMCPVDIDRLKSNPMPRQIKGLSKDYNVHPKVRDLASDIVKQWLAIVKSTPTVVSVPAVNNVDPTTTPAATKISAAAEINRVDSNDNQVTQPSASSDESAEEDADDGNYVKSASPSSSSAESDDADEFIPNKKPVKRPAKNNNKKEKVPRKKQAENNVESKLKSKLVASVNATESKRGSIKLKIEKKKPDLDDGKLKKEVIDEVKPRKEVVDEVKSKKETLSVDERLKMKRKLKEDKEKEKFAKFKQERDKKDKSKDKQQRDDVSKDKAREDKIREDKYKNELSKLIPKSLDKIGRIPKKPKGAVTDEHVTAEDRTKDDASKAKSDDKKVLKKDEKSSSSSKPKETVDTVKREKEMKKPLPVPPKKPVSMSVEKRFAAEEKPKTVKAYNSKFRLTGLEQELIPKPPARKTASSITASSNSLTSSTTPLVDTEAGSSPVSPSLDKTAVKRSPTKDIEIEPAEKKLKSPDMSINDDKSSPVSTKTKKPFLQESDFFMNAMNIAIETQKESLRKRKKPPPSKTESETKTDENGCRKNSDVASSPTIKSDKDVKPTFKFYKDTLDTSNEENVHENVEVPDIKIAPEELKTLENIKNVKLEPSPPKIVEGLRSALSIFRGNKHPKKSVKWKRDDELEAVQYFEVDASERTNVVRTFWDMQMMERTKERESMLMVRKSAENDKMVIQTKWKPLIPIGVLPSSIVRGSNSQEKNIQYARERAVPPALYFNKSMVPDTPAEPDLEIHPVTMPPVIPLDDISGSQDSVSDFSSFKWPEPKLFPPDGSEMGIMAPGFMPNAGGVPQPIFPPFPPPFGQPFFPGAPVPPANWTPPNNGDQTQSSQNSMPMNWVPPPNMVPPPVGPPGMMGPPPPFGMMGPPFPPLPGPGFPGAPNMFPPPNMNQQPLTNNATGSTASNSDSQSYSNSNNNYSSNSESGAGSSRKWNSDDRYSSRKDGWKNNYSDRNRDKRGSSWRSSNRDSRLCRTYQKKGYCNVAGCRFYHEDD